MIPGPIKIGDWEIDTTYLIWRDENLWYNHLPCLNQIADQGTYRYNNTVTPDTLVCRICKAVVPDQIRLLAQAKKFSDNK